jgi:hypothetical protein
MDNALSEGSQKKYRLDGSKVERRCHIPTTAPRPSGSVFIWEVSIRSEFEDSSSLKNETSFSIEEKGRKGFRLVMRAESNKITHPGILR